MTLSRARAVTGLLDPALKLEAPQPEGRGDVRAERHS